ncbi:DMT family transporter [Roseateles toxinivorans]|uniref:Drug/metabolite transporter (DMT)-like permease n=1 Tax=Roseateles toxinivorans TaxID=270368 RepID=A0A4R6QI61_9BURK|nr:DMT family transporter [Roseateles toxinivorans]TDP62556.1 drug/metabolite transporter (DMT)-like permease [Roseateles toxinivorans]
MNTIRLSTSTWSQPATQGLLLGLLGVFIFALSIPMTRLASGSNAAPQLDPVFVALGRAALAGALAALYLRLSGAPRPTRAQLQPLLLTAAGVVFGWPLFLGLAVRSVDAVHASVISGVLPLATATLGALMLRQRPSLGFWACAIAGLALVLGFAWWRGSAGLQLADGLLLLAVFSASYGYVSGARLSQQMTPEQVISWVLVLSLPITVPVALWTWPAQPVAPSAWGGFLYVSVFSMWLGFFAWYRALALGGTVRVSQVQVIQPFLSMLLAVPVLGEHLDGMTVLFAAAVLLVVWLGKKMPVDAKVK